MLRLFSSESSSLSAPASFSQGFSEVGSATGINLNLAGAKVGKRGTLSPVVTLTDQGALEAGRAIALESVAAGERAREDAQTIVTDLGGAAFDFADRSGSRAFEAVDAASERALGFASRASGESLDFAARAADRSFGFASESGARLVAGFNDALGFADATARRERETLADSLSLTERLAGEQSSFARDLFGTSLSAVSGVLREGQAQLGSTVTALNTIAREQSTSTDERVQAIARVALIAVAAVVGVIGLAYVTRGAR